LRRPSQDAKNVVLSEGEVLRLQHPEGAAGQHVGRAEQFQEGSFFRAAYPPGFAGLGHTSYIVVITKSVKTHIGGRRTAVNLVRDHWRDRTGNESVI
jgi:hypothetical protein